MTENGHGPRRWTLSFGGWEFTEDDVTVGAWALLDQLSGAGWDAADPTRGPAAASNLLAVLVAIAEDRPVDEVMMQIAALPASALVAALGSQPVEV